MSKKQSIILSSLNVERLAPDGHNVMQVRIESISYQPELAEEYHR